MADLREAVGLGDGRGVLADGLAVQCERFLHEQVRAVLDRQPLLVLVREGGNTDDDGVERRFLVHLVVVGERRRAVRLGGGRRQFVVDVADCDDVGSLVRFEVVEVDGRDTTRTDKRQLNGHRLPPSGRVLSRYCLPRVGTSTPEFATPRVGPRGAPADSDDRSRCEDFAGPLARCSK